MLDAVKAALGLPAAPVVSTPPNSTLYAPALARYVQEPGATRVRIDVSNSVLAGANPVGSFRVDRRVFRYARIVSYFNGIFVVSQSRLPSQGDVAQASAGVANDPSAFEAVLRAGDVRVLDFGDVHERSLFIQSQLIGPGLALPSGAIVIELDVERFDVRVDQSGIAVSPPTVPVPPLTPLATTKFIQVVPSGTTNIPIPAGATGFLFVLYGNAPARAQGQITVVGDVSGAEYVSGAQQNFFAPTTILTGVAPTDANISVTLSGPYTCQIFWLGTVTVGGSVAITGTATVSITGTPTVQFAAGQTVNIGNTPSVTIASGTVTIAGTPNINIQSQSVTVGVQLPWSAVGSKLTSGVGAEMFTTLTVPPGTQTVGILVESADVTFYLSNLQLTGGQSKAVYLNLGGFNPVSGWILVPVDAARDTTYTVGWNPASAAGITISAWASGLDVPPTKVKPAPWEAPSAVAPQAVLGTVGVVQVVAPVNNKVIRVFGGMLNIYGAFAGGAAQLEDGAGAILVQVRADAIGNFPFNLSGAALPVGSGLNFRVVGGGSATCEVAYSTN